MPEDITELATLISWMLSFVFYLVSFLHFYYPRLASKKSVCTVGTLVGFRIHYTTDEWGSNSIDYYENKRGRKPIVCFNFNGEYLRIGASAPDYSLTKDDIGKKVKIRYRRFLLGIEMVVDTDNAVEKYDRQKKILFWVFASIATSLLILGILAHIYLPTIVL